MRQIKFRAWDKGEKKMSESFELGGNNSVAYRDINAAKNILAEALKHNERGETKRVSVRRESLVS